MLVNNAGCGRFGPILDQSLDEIESMIELNVTSLTLLSRLFAADFKRLGGGFILNHASFSAIQPPPYYSTYAGTKAHVLAFSQALHHDLRSSGIKVSALCTGFFASEFFDKSQQEPSFIVKLIMLKPEVVARRRGSRRAAWQACHHSRPRLQNPAPTPEAVPPLLRDRPRRLRRKALGEAFGS